MKLLSLVAITNAVDIGPAHALDKSPLLGGEGREGILRVPTLPTTGTILIQGAPAVYSGPNGPTEPAEASTTWATLHTVNAASLHDVVIQDLPDYIRWNVTVVDAAASIKMALEGMQ